MNQFVSAVRSKIATMIARRQWGRLLAWGGIALWAFGLCGYFFSTQPWTRLYVDNQHTYFIQGLRLSGRHPYLELDWFAQTRPLHIAFTVLVAGLEWLGILQQSMTVLDILFRLVFLFSCGLLAWALWGFAGPEHVRQNPLRRAALTLSVLSLYLLSLWPVFQLSAFFEQIGITSLALAAEKFGFYYSFGGFAAFRFYTEPAAFSMLIFTGLVLLPYRRWRWAAALWGIAALFHASFLIHTGVLAGCLALFLFFKEDRRTAFEVVGIYAAFVLPLVIYILTQMTGPFTAQANEILALNRVPHHALPSRWWDWTESAHTVIVVLALALLAWKGTGVLRWLPAVVAGYVAIGIAVVVWRENLTIAILMPWRASGVLYAVAQLTVLTAGVYGIIKVLSLLHLRAGDFFLIVPVALVCLGISNHGLFTVLESEYEDISTYELYPFYRQIQQHTEPDALVITPQNQMPFRLAAQRAQYADWKSHPYQGTQVLAWWQRIAFLQDFYAEASSAAQRQTMCRSVGADYYMLQILQNDQEQMFDGENAAVLTYQDWGLFLCP